MALKTHEESIGLWDVVVSSMWHSETGDICYVASVSIGGCILHNTERKPSGALAYAAALTWIRDTCTATLTALGDA